MRLCFTPISLCLLVFASLTPLLTAQHFEQTAYMELPVDKKEGYNYRFISMGADGLLCYRNGSRLGQSSKRQITLYRLSPELDTLWQKDYSISYESDIVTDAYYRNYLYIVYEKKKGEYKFLRIDTRNGKAAEYFLQRIQRFELSHFVPTDTVFYLAGQIKNAPAILRFQPNGRKTTPFNSVSQIKGELREFKVDLKRGVAAAAIEEEGGSRGRGTFFHTYDLDGKLLNRFFLPREDQYTPLTYRLRPLNGTDMIVIGTYAYKKEEAAQGVYSLRLKGQYIDFFDFYDFFYFRNFFSYLPEKKRERLKRKIDRKRKRGKIKTLRYYLLLHELDTTRDGLTLAGESYQTSSAGSGRSLQYDRRYIGQYDQIGEQWRKQTYTQGYDDDDFITPSYNRQRAFENDRIGYEYEYEHAFVCAFDSTGKMRWDNAYVYGDDIEKPSLRYEKAQVHTEGDQAVFLHAEYVEDGKDSRLEAYWQTTRGNVPPLPRNDENHARDTLALPLPNEDDRYEYMDTGGVCHWHDKAYFLAGVCEIKNKELEDRKREVLFIRKLVLKPGPPPNEE